jgi:hypothetical protein
MIVPFVSVLPSSQRRQLVAKGVYALGVLPPRAEIILTLEDVLYRQDIVDEGYRPELRTAEEVREALEAARYVLSVDDRNRFTLWK